MYVKNQEIELKKRVAKAKGYHHKVTIVEDTPKESSFITVEVFTTEEEFMIAIIEKEDLLKKFQ